MNRLTGTALITGASAGIGAELARVFAAHGHDLILVARRRDALEALAGQLEGRHGITATVMPSDLSEPGAAVELFETVRGAGLQVDILVNNAGFGLAGPFVETDIERELQMIQVNVAALTHLTKLFVRPMVQRHNGAVLNVASTAALYPGPFMSIYYATKGFILSFTEALAEELSDSGVRVTALCPGPTVSEFHAVAGTTGTGIVGVMRVADTHAVAKFGYNALRRGVRVAIPGAQNKVLAQARRLAPRRLVTYIVRRLQRQR